MIELEPKYCDVIIRRWQEFTGEAARLEDSGRVFSDPHRVESIKGRPLPRKTGGAEAATAASEQNVP